MHCCAPKICDKSGFGTPAPFAPGPPVYSSSGKADALCNQHTYTYPQYPLKNTLSQKSQYCPVDFSLVQLGRMTMLQIGKDLASDVFFFWKITLLSPSGDLGIGLVWDNNPTPPDRSFLVRLLKSSSNWTKLSMIGPQLFSGWYQMILDVFRCSQQFSDCFPTVFRVCFLTVEILFKLN